MRMHHINTEKVTFIVKEEEIIISIFNTYTGKYVKKNILITFLTIYVSPKLNNPNCKCTIIGRELPQQQIFVGPLVLYGWLISWSKVESAFNFQVLKINYCTLSISL